MERELVCQARALDHEAETLFFLCEAYHPSFYWFEVVECLRRLSLSGALVFIRDGRCHARLISAMASARDLLSPSPCPHVQHAADRGA